MSDTGMVLKSCRNRHFRGISFKMVHISTNFCIIEQQTTAINNFFHCSFFFKLAILLLQSIAYGRQLQWRRPLGTMVSIPLKRPMNGYRKLIEIPGVSLQI